MTKTPKLNKENNDDENPDNLPVLYSKTLFT
jgi:hypothetical protein